MKYRLFSLRKKKPCSFIFFLVLSFPYWFITGKTILGPLLSPSTPACKQNKPNSYKNMCMFILQVCWLSMPVESADGERNGNVLEAIAWFIQQSEDSWCLSGSTANSLGAKGYLRVRCIVSASGKCHEPPLSLRAGGSLTSLDRQLQAKAMDP